MSYVINLATHKRYNMQHAHHKHESFMAKLCDMFKLWHYRYSVRKKRKNNQYNKHFSQNCGRRITRKT